MISKRPRPYLRNMGPLHTGRQCPRRRNTAARFLTEVDSAIVLHNASTQFFADDGGVRFFGAEIVLHGAVFMRGGPVGAKTSNKL